ncbi:TetR/AcrR family transcriptional regulator [Rhodococcus sp. Eu-32]|uniref:TetR/AcrR family transcriptional regulator n=1 Tax=Rhodococcus sp. Eu-32 TaxID=1017319 RepID=UPI000DF13270|nr:TetR/AcrR family transcriptional regulator [Rhodococcus sp. Eu-32]RRQ27820.1 TetR/AcrR family transcriptional regulator [Rhodococcus sp. Eu-32]
MARAGITATRLVEVASEMADDIGFDNLTVLALARSFGVKDASLYSHIKNLRDLRQRVAVASLAELADRVSDALAGRAGKDALVAFAGAYRDYAREHPGRYAATNFELDSDAVAKSDAHRHSQMSRAVLRAYDLGEPAETDAVRLLGSFFHGFIALESAGGFSHTPRPTEESWVQMLDVLHHALANWPNKT